jgi:hypothetical protein
METMLFNHSSTPSKQQRNQKRKIQSALIKQTNFTPNSFSRLASNNALKLETISTVDVSCKDVWKLDRELKKLDYQIILLTTFTS